MLQAQDALMQASIVKFPHLKKVYQERFIKELQKRAEVRPTHMFTKAGDFQRYIQTAWSMV